MSIIELKQPAIKLELNGIGRVLLRPVTLGDEIIFEDRFKKDSYSIMTGGKLNEVIALAYNQIVDKSKFEHRKLVISLADGTKEEMELEGEELLGKLLIGSDDVNKLVEATFSCVTLSLPEVREVVKKKIILNPIKFLRNKSMIGFSIYTIFLLIMGGLLTSFFL